MIRDSKNLWFQSGRFLEIVRLMNKTIALFAVFVLSAPFGFGADDASSDEAAGIAKLRARYQKLEYSRGAEEGRDLVARFPASTELRAWYVGNLAPIDRPAADRMARALRYAHPQDSWSWFAVAVSELYSEREAVDARHASETMLARYKGIDSEAFRLHCRILRDRFELDDARKFLAGKTQPWAVADRDLELDAHAWIDQTLIDG